MMVRMKRKTIYAIRHAEAEHNIPPYDTRIRDAKLTRYGSSQAQLLASQFPFLENVDLIVCSPLRRTLQTALLAFREQLIGTGKQIIALPELQELSNRPCDTGSSLPELLTEFREDPVDLSHVPFDWESKNGQWSSSEARTLTRMTKLRSWLANRTEANIVIIGHAHCLQLLVRAAERHAVNDGIEEIQLGYLPIWQHCEWRVFHAEEHASKVLTFEETRASKKAGARQYNVPQTDEENSSPECKNRSTSSRASSRERRSFRWSKSSSTLSLDRETSSPLRDRARSSPVRGGGVREAWKLLSSVGGQK